MNVVDAACLGCGKPMRWLSGSPRVHSVACLDAYIEAKKRAAAPKAGEWSRVEEEAVAILGAAGL